jgi:hypothetical protein
MAVRRAVLAVAAACAWLGAARAVPVDFDLKLYQPPVVVDSQAPAGCTVTYLVADTVNNDIYAVRMRIAAAETDTPIDRRLPCPRAVPPRIGVRALDSCTSRAAEPRACVFADMGRGFEAAPELNGTAENFARCASDKATDIGVACFASGGPMVCNVGCGNSPAEAAALARARCEEKQQRSCPLVATVPVAAP